MEELKYLICTDCFYCYINRSKDEYIYANSCLYSPGVFKFYHKFIPVSKKRFIVELMKQGKLEVLYERN